MFYMDMAENKMREAEELIHQVRELVGEVELAVAQREHVSKAKARLVKLGLEEQSNNLLGQVVEILGSEDATPSEYQKAVQLLVLRYLITGERKISDIGMGIKQILDVVSSTPKEKEPKYEDGIDTEV